MTSMFCAQGQLQSKQPNQGVPYGDINSRCTSPLRASPISLPPMLAMACRARQLKSSLWSRRSFLMLLTTRCRSSCCSWRNRVIARYPICFSEYLFADMRLTASRCPNPMSQPRMYMYRSYGLMSVVSVPFRPGCFQHRAPCRHISSCGIR